MSRRLGSPQVANLEAHLPRSLPTFTVSDSDALIAELNEHGARIVISQHPRRIPPLRIDAEVYKWRHLIENFFCRLKEFKRLALRADKTDQSFAAIIHLAAAVINSR